MLNARQTHRSLGLFSAAHYMDWTFLPNFIEAGFNFKPPESFPIKVKHETIADKPT